MAQVSRRFARSRGRLCAARAAGWLLACALAAVCAIHPAFAQSWVTQTLRETRFQVPSDWTRTGTDENMLEYDSPDRRYSLWVRWWFPDEPLLGYDDQLAHEGLTLGGEQVLWIHSEGGGERMLMLAWDRPNAAGEQFLFQLIGRGVDLETHKAMLRQLVTHLLFDNGLPPPGGAPADAPLPPPGGASALPAPGAAREAPLPLAGTDTSRPGADYLAAISARFGTDCRLLDLGSWDHPTKAVMIRAGTRIEFVTLCRGDTYPIFGVRFPYDPLAATEDYFYPLYADMFQANGDWDYSFLDLDGATMIDVLGRGRSGLTLDYIPVPDR